jgi:hypothetical protein
MRLALLLAFLKNRSKSRILVIYVAITNAHKNIVKMRGVVFFDVLSQTVTVKRNHAPAHVKVLIQNSAQNLAHFIFVMFTSPSINILCINVMHIRIMLQGQFNRRLYPSFLFSPPNMLIRSLRGAAAPLFLFPPSPQGKGDKGGWGHSIKNTGG